MGRQRLGILGGTFDPIHNGHLMIARAMQEQLHLDRVLFIPDYIPPHKRGRECSPSADRLAMTLLATRDNPLCTVSDMELRRGGVSYTSDTLRQLYRRWHRFYDLYFLIGADSAEQLPTWHNIREAMEYATFAAAARPGFAAGPTGAYPIVLGGYTGAGPFLHGNPGEGPPGRIDCEPGTQGSSGIHRTERPLPQVGALCFFDRRQYHGT